MKEFNLARALAGDPVITRDGKRVSELFHTKTLKDRLSVLAIIDGELVHYSKEGKYFVNNDSINDLFMVPVKRQEWRIIQYYLDSADPTGQYYTIGDEPFESEEMAQKWAVENQVPNYVKAVLIREWEE